MIEFLFKKNRMTETSETMNVICKLFWLSLTCSLKVYPIIFHYTYTNFDLFPRDQTISFNIDRTLLKAIYKAHPIIKNKNKKTSQFKILFHKC